MTTLAEAFRKPVYGGGNPDETTRLVWAYRYWRNRGFPAITAGDLAGHDIHDGKTRYPSSGRDYGYQPAFSAFGESHLRWIENPRAAGLRFVGFADELAGLRHTGWFIDEFQDETVRGVVYQIAGRNGRPVFVPGYADPHNDGPVCLSFDELFFGDPDVHYLENEQAARDCARRADSIAERMAEQEREYQAASLAGLRHSELAEDISTTRKQTLALIREFKTLAKLIPAGAGMESCKAIREIIEYKIDRINHNRKERARLADEFGNHSGFNDV